MKSFSIAAVALLFATAVSAKTETLDMTKAFASLSPAPTKVVVTLHDEAYGRDVDFRFEWADLTGKKAAETAELQKAVVQLMGESAGNFGIEFETGMFCGFGPGDNKSVFCELGLQLPMDKLSALNLSQYKDGYERSKKLISGYWDSIFAHLQKIGTCSSLEEKKVS